jgi:predicted branched-subunit amino acid permease
MKRWTTTYGEGLRVGLGLAVPTFLLAVAFGASAARDGWGEAAPVIASMTVFSGSAQFALVSVLASGGAWAAVASASLMNLRFVPMAVAAAPALRGGRVRRGLEAQSVVDASWAAAHRGGGKYDRELMIGATVAQWPAWVAGTALGAVLAPSAHLEQSLGLDVVFPAFFAVLLVDEVRVSGLARVAAALGGLVTAVALLALPAGPALLAGSVAALLGLRRARTVPEAA